MQNELNDMQRDALTETINIGVGRASRALSLFAQSEVAMSVPIIIQSEPEDIRSIVSPALFDSPDVSSVSRRVVGLDADVVMIFQASTEALKEMTKTNIVREGQEDPTDVRDAVINKIGYLVIESCLDQIENVVGRNIERFKLHYFPRLPKGIFHEKYAPQEGVIIVKIDIAIPKRNITGHLLCALTHKAANRMADGLDSLVEDSLG
jgi:chemotaxis protein CheC